MWAATLKQSARRYRRVDATPINRDAPLHGHAQAGCACENTKMFFASMRPSQAAFLSYGLPKSAMRIRFAHATLETSAQDFAPRCSGHAGSWLHPVRDAIACYNRRVAKH